MVSSMCFFHFLSKEFIHVLTPVGKRLTCFASRLRREMLCQNQFLLSNFRMSLLSNHGGVNITQTMSDKRVSRDISKLIECPSSGSLLLNIASLAVSFSSGFSPGQRKRTPNQTLLMICNVNRMVFFGTSSIVGFVDLSSISLASFEPACVPLRIPVHCSSD
jgi:hypothetical protein